MKSAERKTPPARAGFRAHGRCVDSRPNYNIRLPPFGRSLVAGRRFQGTSADGQNHTFWLVVGPDAWNVAREFRENGRAVTMLPPNEDPLAYDWSILRNHPPVFLVRAGEVSGQELRCLLEAVMADGVERVADLGTLDRYVREVVHG